jgi:hypothetical protein
VLPFTASSTQTTISFVDVSNSDVFYVGLDNVSVTETAPVPIPSTILLFGTGIAGLVSTRLRKIPAAKSMAKTRV